MRTVWQWCITTSRTTTCQYRMKSTTDGVNPQRTKMNCIAVIHSEGEESITFVDQPSTIITNGIRKRTCRILKTPNGLGKRASKLTAQSAYQLSKDQVFLDPDRHRRNVGDHPHYKFRWHFEQINKDVPPDPLKHLRRPLEIGARFTIENYPWSEYQPDPNYTPNYHPDWKGWRVSEPVMINLTNGRSIYMGEIRPDTSAHVFQPPMGEGWIKPYDEHAIESRPMKSAQASEQIPVQLRDLRPYITPQEMQAR